MQKDIFITVDICNVYYKKLVRCFDSDSPTSIYSGPLGRKRCEILLGVHDKTVCNPKVQFLRLYNATSVDTLRNALPRVKATHRLDRCLW